jgi:hypothetical protein
MVWQLIGRPEFNRDISDGSVHPVVTGISNECNDKRTSCCELRSVVMEGDDARPDRLTSPKFGPWT